VRDCRTWESVEHVSKKDDSQLNAWVKLGDGETPENRLLGWQMVSYYSTCDLLMVTRLYSSLIK
jgi:hypothetical protein